MSEKEKHFEVNYHPDDDQEDLSVSPDPKWESHLIIDYDKIVKTTKNAYLLNIGLLDFWVPKSQIVLDKELSAGYMNEWFFDRMESTEDFYGEGHFKWLKKQERYRKKKRKKKRDNKKVGVSEPDTKQEEE